MNRSQLSRREILKQTVAAGICAALPATGSSQDRPGGWQSKVLAFLERSRHRDGGFGWPDQLRSHLTPTFASLGAYQVLKRQPADKERITEFVRTHHPRDLKGRLEQELREFEYQQIQSLLWLGADAGSFREQVRSWTKPVPYMAQYEKHRYPVLRHQVTAFTCRALLGLPLDDLSPEFIEYVTVRRRENGSFNNTPAADGGDGHVLNTWWALEALQTIGRAQDKKDETIAWFRDCQLDNGGFIWQPRAEWAGVADVAYTWAAVKALHLLGSEPRHRDRAISWLWSLWYGHPLSGNGGFSDRPGWLSNLVATHYALEALSLLGGLDAGPTEWDLTVEQRAYTRSTYPKGDLKVYSIQLEAHGKGSPADAVELARALRIHLWGAKNARPEWIAKAQQIADRNKTPVTFFTANEEYGTWVDVPGLGTYSHTSDIIAPAKADIGPSLANAGVVSWSEFRTRRLAPLEKGAGRLIWQFGENEELVRLFLDDSLARGGYAAISTFHFGNADFTNTEPFLKRYYGQIPFVALQDAHGDEPWWFADMTTGFRTLFVAREPTWDGWLNALKNNWVVSVRHDAVSKFETWMHGGPNGMYDWINECADQWCWWDNPAIERPLVSIVPIRPDDEFEVGRPDKGVTLRVRCACANTAQGLPREPISELLSLSLDGRELPLPSQTSQRKAQNVADRYHSFKLPEMAQGKHSATAVVRVVRTGSEVKRTIEFEL